MGLWNKATRERVVQNFNSQGGFIDGMHNKQEFIKAFKYGDAQAKEYVNGCMQSMAHKIGVEVGGVIQTFIHNDLHKLATFWQRAKYNKRLKRHPKTIKEVHDDMSFADVVTYIKNSWILVTTTLTESSKIHYGELEPKQANLALSTDAAKNEKKAQVAKPNYKQKPVIEKRKIPAKA